MPSVIDKFYYKLNYRLFFANRGAKSLHRLAVKLPLWYKCRIDLKNKRIFNKGLELHFRIYSRLYLYQLGLTYRYDNLLSEYCLEESVRLDLAPNDFLIDCGANIGEFTLAFFHRYGTFRSIAFEPDPNEFDILNKNLSMDNCVNENMALSNKNEFLDFYCLNETGDSSFEIRGDLEPIKVAATTLDEYVKTKEIACIGILKIEAEGFEPEVLLGAKKCLKIIKYIAVDAGFERNSDSTFTFINNFLVSKDFELIGFDSRRMCMLFRNKGIQLKYS